MYLWNNCEKLLKFKTGAANHNYLIHCNQFLNYICHNRHQSAIEYILRYIAASNIPYRAMDNEKLRTALHFLDPTFDFAEDEKHFAMIW